MPPNQQNPYGPQPPYNPNPAPQQAPNGQYQVLPPLPVGQNNGHSGHNPYEFIVNPNTPKHGVNLLGGDSFIKKIALLVGGVIVLMIVATVVLSAVGPKSSTPGLEAIAERQQEIVRVATSAQEQTIGQDTANFITNVQLSVQSSQNDVVNYLASHHTKLSKKKLALDQSAATDSLLANAASAGTFSSAIVQNLTTQLQDCQKQVQTAFKQTSNAKLRVILNAAYDTDQKLLDQAKALSVNAS